MKVLSWNVNGLRAAVRKGFAEWLTKAEPDVLALQEVRAHREQVAPDVACPDGYDVVFASAKRPGYSGVALYSKRPFDEVRTSLGEDRFDDEGRLVIGRLGRLWIASVYFPNGNGKNRDNGRIPYKLDFYRKLFDELEALRADGGRVIILGDYNTAHRPIDLARPKQNQKTSGFRPEERAEIDRWIDAGWIDTFRHHYPEAEGCYSWWSLRKGVREKNVGWRIDLAMASVGALPFVRDAFIASEVEGSDHCPIGVFVDGRIVDHE